MITIAQPSTVRAHIGETFDVRLEGIPTSGYTWELAPGGLPDVVEIVATEMAMAAAHGQVAGGPVTQVFRFRAVRTGEASIRFCYRRRWEKEPLRETRVMVAIDASPAAGPVGGHG